MLDIPFTEQMIFTGIKIEIDTTSEYATKKDMKYISWALQSIACMIEKGCTSGLVSGGVKWWLEREE